MDKYKEINKIRQGLGANLKSRVDTGKQHSADRGALLSTQVCLCHLQAALCFRPSCAFPKSMFTERRLQGHAGAHLSPQCLIKASLGYTVSPVFKEKKKTHTHMQTRTLCVKKITKLQPVFVSLSIHPSQLGMTLQHFYSASLVLGHIS